MFEEILQLDTRLSARPATTALLRSETVFGLEVTDPEYATACAAGNVDPQHLGGRRDLSSIEVIAALFRGQAKAATVLPDLDSLGSMAVLEIAMDLIAKARAFEGEVLERIELIGAADRFERGGWPGVRPLPTKERPWFEEAAGATESRPLAAMGAVVQDRRLPLTERVRLLKLWLATGQEPQEYRTRVETERLDMIRALEEDEIIIGKAAHGCIATVVSTHRAGVGLGYHCAPVVIALNPQFRFGEGDVHAKFTIAQFTDDYIELDAILAELNEQEAATRSIPLAGLKNRWGGSPTIGGSPQGESSRLSLREVVRTVKRHLR
jgi:hypothetical protein